MERFTVFQLNVLDLSAATLQFWFILTGAVFSKQGSDK